MRILVVDDSTFERKLLIRILSRLGHTCQEAVDGKAALALLPKAGPLDAIMIDWHMPGMSGSELVVQLRADPSYRGIHLIMVTSESDHAHIAEAIEAGVDEYIMKPITPEVVDEKLQLLEFMR
jgi:two-component system chemotaxis response regulator CheY